MTDLVEQVARAIWGEESYRPVGWQVSAQAAIATVLGAMKEPSEGMVSAGIEQANECTGEWTAKSSCVGEHCWQAMLQAFASEHNVGIG